MAELLLGWFVVHLCLLTDLAAVCLGKLEFPVLLVEPLLSLDERVFGVFAAVSLAA